MLEGVFLHFESSAKREWESGTRQRIEEMVNAVLSLDDNTYLKFNKLYSSID